MDIFQRALGMHKAGVTQKDIAAVLNVSQGTVSRLLEAAKVGPEKSGRCPCCGRKIPPSVARNLKANATDKVLYDIGGK